MDYAELVEFVEWMFKNGTNKPYVWINKKDEENGENDHIQFDGVIEPEDVERFNKRKGE